MILHQLIGRLGRNPERLFLEGSSVMDSFWGIPEVRSGQPRIMMERFRDPDCLDRLSGYLRAQDGFYADGGGWEREEVPLDYIALALDQAADRIRELERSVSV
jgi:hypothetical protein